MYLMLNELFSQVNFQSFINVFTNQIHITVYEAYALNRLSWKQTKNEYHPLYGLWYVPQVQQVPSWLD